MQLLVMKQQQFYFTALLVLGIPENLDPFQWQDWFSSPVKYLHESARNGTRGFQSIVMVDKKCFSGLIFAKYTRKSAANPTD